MEFIIELLLDLILEGSMELMPDRKVPMFLRVLAGLILVTVYGALLLLGIQLMISGFQQKDWPLCIAGTVLWLLIAAFGIYAWRKANKEESD